MKSVLEKIIAAIALGIAIGMALCFVIAQSIWIQPQNILVYSRDYDSHLASISTIYHAKANPLLIWKYYRASFTPFIHQPPLGYLVSYPFLRLLGFSFKTLYIVGLFWWCALFIVVFLLGKLVARSYIGGALACTLFVFNPSIAIMSYAINLEIPLTVMVGLTAYLVLKSQTFKDRKIAFLAGTFCGLAFITKPAALIYLGPLCASVLVSKRDELKPKLTNLFLAAIIGLAVALVFYAPLLDFLHRDVGRHFDFNFRQPIHSFKVFGSLFQQLTSKFELTFYLLSFLFLIYMRDEFLLPLFFWSFGSFFILLFSHFHDHTYLFPSYLGFCLLGVRALLRTDESRYKTLQYMLTLVLTILFALNLRAEIFKQNTSSMYDNHPATLRHLCKGLVEPLFFPDPQTLTDLKRIFLEEKNAVRAELNRRYKQIQARNMTLVSLHINELTIYEKWVWTAFGLDRPELLSWIEYTAQNRALAVWEPSKFIDSFKGTELVVWMGIQCPDKMGTVYDINCPEDKLTIPVGRENQPYSLSEQERKNAQENLKLLNECTIKQGEYTFWRGDKVCFLKPKAGCFE